jgi:hypothetical protein
MWLTILIGIIFFYTLYQFDKRIKTIEQTRGKGYSHWFSVGVQDAIIKHRKFGEITGIKSATEGKNYNEWSKVDKEKWSKMSPKISEQMRKWYVTITYLASEDAYFVNNYKDSPTIIFRKDTTNLLYSSIVVGDKNGFDPNIEFLLYERLIKKENGNSEWVLVPCLQYSGKWLAGEKDFIVLCEFPHFAEKNENDLKHLGFEIKRSGGDDIYTDQFGKMQGIPTEIKYIKNGAEIRYVY